MLLLTFLELFNYECGVVIGSYKDKCNGADTSLTFASDDGGRGGAIAANTVKRMGVADSGLTCIATVSHVLMPAAMHCCL